MDYLSFFKKILVPEEPIAGLEISDSNLRLVLLSLDKKTDLISTRQNSQQALAAGIIEGGVVKDAAKLRQALLDFKKTLNPPVDYVVASIPADLVYVKKLAFPKNLEGQNLIEAIKLAVDFQFPFKSADAYCSWEINDSQNPQQVFVAEALKKNIDPYIESIRPAFNLVALEIQPASFARAAVLEKEKPVLLKIDSQSGAGLFIIEDGEIIFSRLITNDVPENKLRDETSKLIDFYEADAGEKISQIIDLSQNAIAIDKKINFPKQENSLGLVALGAAQRGLIERRVDNFISLSPISPQKAYKYHKAVSFTSIMTGLSIGLSIFFIVAFLGTWILMIALQQQDVQKTDAFSSLPSTADLGGVETKIQNANELIITTAGILKTSPRWSGLITELQNSIIKGIIVDGISLPAPEGTMTISGMAGDRDTLNLFRDKLKTSAILTNINLPLTNLDQKSDIPFTISFDLKNPSLLYKNPS